MSINYRVAARIELNLIDQNCSLERIKYKLDSSLHGWPTFTKHCDGNLEIIYITLKERQCKLSIGSYVDCLEEDPDLSILHLQISKKKDIWPMGRSIGKGFSEFIRYPLPSSGWSDRKKTDKRWPQFVFPNLLVRKQQKMETDIHFSWCRPSKIWLILF